MMDTFDYTLLAAPFAAGLLVLATHVPLGREVLRRGIIFIDLAIAQVAGLGVIVAQDLAGSDEVDPNGWPTQLTAAASAALGALLLTWTGKRWPEIQEALIGLLFVLAASVGLMLLSHNPHGGEHLKDLLAGQILWVSGSRLVLPAILSGLLLAIWYAGRARLGDAGFYLLFAWAVTLSVQLVGVLLVFASLIGPALASRGRPLWVGYIAGAAGYGLGLVASAWGDWPSGATIVCALSVVALAGLHRRVE